MDMETAITQNVNIKDQNTARNIVADAIKTGQRSKVNSDETRIVTELKKKPVYYMKAGKGNAVVEEDKRRTIQTSTSRSTTRTNKADRQDPERL